MDHSVQLAADTYLSVYLHCPEVRSLAHGTHFVECYNPAFVPEHVAIAYESLQAHEPVYLLFHFHPALTLPA